MEIESRSTGWDRAFNLQLWPCFICVLVFLPQIFFQHVIQSLELFSASQTANVHGKCDAAPRVRLLECENA